ncbi:hypothetical protein BDV98DRAFT_307048 [Pterulicium gracile]|uniref:F-box domain-containing protein n=1 Tax=Pterulicium gracile TaxID=1884261 RepID=A0A5C3Q334_9AGAR|nr:hypothetical protein BDV98DRAFT_307048 [Pterula gracilis]
MKPPADGACPHCELDHDISFQYQNYESPWDNNLNIPVEDLARSNLVVIEGTPKIQQLTNAIEHLQGLRASLRSAVNKHASFIAPVNHLPNDILFLIFEFFHKIGGYVYLVSDAIWSVSAVCRRWRSLLLSCLQLWTRLSQHASSWTESRDNYHRACVQLKRTAHSKHLLTLVLNLTSRSKRNAATTVDYEWLT